MVITPESDYNCNKSPQKLSVGAMVGVMNGSINSSKDFSHDNSDYQWFLDYSCREGISYQSVLSSLYESYTGTNELSYYDDIAKHLDANLAEMDIESFRAEDMSLLLEIPNICRFGRKSKEMDSSIYITKSLFSPVKESHISLDSLDLDSYPENKDIILTCKANKSNYTIAFEGSTLYSDESFYVDPGERSHLELLVNNNLQSKNFHSIDRRMIISEHCFPTISILENKYKNSASCQDASRGASFGKCVSLPNINHLMDIYNISDSKIDKDRNKSDLLKYPDCIPFKNLNEIKNYFRNSVINKGHNIKHPAFNLVKIFIQQKSSSTDARMDVSSGCWPSSEESSSSSLEKGRLQAKTTNTSGEWLYSNHRHKKNNPENSDSFQLDSLDVCDKSFIENSIDDKSLKIPSREHKIKQICNVINNNNNNNYIKARGKEENNRINMLTKSTQTSSIHLENSLSFKPPSFFCKTNIVDKIEKERIFVIYPNYSLPDLSFVNSDTSKIFFTSYKLDIFKRKHNFQYKNQRHQNIIMKNIKPDHIEDWNSLLTLLPYDIVRKLEQIPEAVTITQTEPPLKPMFCLPLKRNKKRFCDCVRFLKYHELDCCRSESTEYPFSSGYRGSSTVLTDSELMRNNDGFNDFIEDHIYNRNYNKSNLIQPKSILRNYYRNGDSITEVEKNKLGKNKSEKRFSLPISYKCRADEFVTDTQKQCCDQNQEDNFISPSPAELKNFQEIAQSSFKYDPFKLKTEVSEASHKKVSFNEKLKQKFVTPPNSPDNSIANTIIITNKKQKPLTQKDRPLKLGIISSNRFKRLQVQWELLSKESSLLCGLKSEDSSPVPSYQKSKIPRPIGFTTLKKESPVVLSDNSYYNRDQRLKLTKIPSLRPKIKYSGVLKYSTRKDDSSIQKKS